MNSCDRAMRSVTLDALAAGGLALALAACANAQTAVGEQELASLRSVLRATEFSPPSKHQVEVSDCEGFLSALRAGSEIRSVPPVVRTNDGEDSRLSKYEQCSNPTIWVSGNETSPRAFLGLETIGDSDYRLYVLPDRESPNELLYAEMSRESRELNRYGGFFVVNSSTCMIEGKAPAALDPLEKKLDASGTKTLNLVLQYKQDDYVLTLADTAAGTRIRPDDPPNYLLALWRKRANEFKEICIWRQATSEK